MTPLPRCGAKTRRGDRHPCRLAAGHGTDHVGYGNCRYHTGNTTPGRVHGEREKIAALTRHAIGEAAPIAPSDAMELSVWLANATVGYWRARLAEEDRPSPALVECYRRALQDLSKFSHRAVESKVAERQAQATERLAEQIAMICEKGLAAMVEAGLQIDREMRTVYARAVAEAIEPLERQPVPVLAEVVSLPA
jgi:hypothetical protein